MAEACNITVTTGSQDALGKAFDMLLGEGDSLLCEAPTYSGSLAYLQAIPGLNLAGVGVDEDGLIPQELERILSEWDSAHGLGGAKGWKRPKVLYTIPTGSNPTGVSLSAVCVWVRVRACVGVYVCVCVCVCVCVFDQGLEASCSGHGSHQFQQTHTYTHATHTRLRIVLRPIRSRYGKFLRMGKLERYTPCSTIAKFSGGYRSRSSSSSMGAGHAASGVCRPSAFERH